MLEKKVLITDSVHEILINGLKEYGFEVEYTPDISYAEVQNSIQEYLGLIINSKINCDQNFINKASHLKFIGRLGSGREVVDIPYAESKGIQVYFSPEGNKNAVAEHALGMILALSNQLTRADLEVRNKIWQREQRRGWELKGKTIGIIGFGHTGSQFAKKLMGMEMQVLAHDKYVSSFTKGMIHVQEVDLNTILEESDIISFHLPSAEDTFHYCNQAFIERCKKKPVIINTSRGNVINTYDLVNALENGNLAGACLDVFENEKVLTFTKEENELYQRLYQLPNVVLSPHIAGWTVQSKYLLGKVLLDKILKNVQH